MPLTHSTKVLAMMLFAALICPAHAAGIDIKGIRLGMTRDELIAQGAIVNSKQNFVMPGFTVGGVPAILGNADLTLKDERLDTFTFFFAPDDFDEVLAAVKIKYPKTKCESSELQNGFGAKFPQTYCTYTDGKTTLRVRRMLSNEVGLLSLVANSTLKQMDDRAQRKKGDI